MGGGGEEEGDEGGSAQVRDSWSPVLGSRKGGFFLLLWALLVGLCPPGAEGRAWRYDEYPDPITQPFACGRSAPSWVCDPERILSSNVTEQVDLVLKSISTQTSGLCGPGKRPYEMGVAVLGSMDRRQARQLGGFGEGAERFCQKIGNQWAIGNERCKNGIMLLFSRDDQVVFIKTGSGAKEVLTNENIADIIQEMRPYLRQGSFDQAILLGTQLIYKSLRGEFHQMPTLPLPARCLIVVGSLVALFLFPLASVWVCYPVILLADLRSGKRTWLPGFRDLAAAYFPMETLENDKFPTSPGPVPYSPALSP